MNTSFPLALQLARAQFGFSISFHIVLAAFSIGLANFLMVLEALWLWKKKRVFLDIYQYWSKIFALNVAVGVVSGVVLEYEFGTNWGGLATRAGAILGPLMMYEVMVAFFLEAGFLGIMLFGMKKVSPRSHFFATACVALGSLMSAFWILAANSWMQTPAGYTLTADGRFLPEDWWAIVFNPSFPYRLVHMTLAAFLGTAFMVGGVGAWHLLREGHATAVRPLAASAANPGARLMFSMALWTAALVAPLQVIAGDLHGDNTLQYEPQKVAAMEGDWLPRPPGSGEPMVLFAWPDMDQRRNRLEVSIPHVASLYLRHDWTGTIRSLREFPPADIPPVPIVFFAFRAMVGLGFMMLGVGIAGVVLRWRRRLFETRWLQWAMVALAPAGFVAMLCGWIVTEVGRQPYTVYGLLRTVQSASRIALPGVATSLVVIALVYLLVFGIGLAFLFRLVAAPPHHEADEDEEDDPKPPLPPSQQTAATPGVRA